MKRSTCHHTGVYLHTIWESDVEYDCEPDEYEYRCDKCKKACNVLDEEDYIKILKIRSK